MIKQALISSAAMAFTVVVCSSAVAQYKAEDVVRAFTRPPATLGSSRGLCIGTESECNVRAPTRAADAAAPNFDLLITFEYNSNVLTPGAKQNLSEFATALRNPLLVEKRFLIEGHTDAKGGHRYNLELSKRRAAAVVQFLTEQGVDKAHLFARGYGETKPRATDPFNPANRRVEARVTE